MRALSRRAIGTFVAAAILLLAGAHSQAEQQAKPAAPLFWSGWGEIPGNGFTKDAPGATSYLGRLYLFVRGTDNRIYQNILSGTSWGTWGEVPYNNGFTPSGPAATVYGGSLYLFVRGTDDRIYRNVLTGTTWSGWGEVSGSGFTLGAPGATVYNGALQLFVQGTDNRIYLNTLFGTTWGAWGEIPYYNGFTPSGPDAAVYRGRLYLVVQGTNNRIYQNREFFSFWSGGVRFHISTDSRLILLPSRSSRGAYIRSYGARTTESI
jgi:hypothetical protein